MKLLSLLAVLIAVAAFGQIAGNPPIINQSVQEYLGGEHHPLRWGGGTADTIRILAGTSDTTDWIQIGYSQFATSSQNAIYTRYNPEQFTLSLHIVDRDATGTPELPDAWFEITTNDDSTNGYWNADTSNYFVDSANLNRADYGIWTFGVQTAGTYRDYALRIMRGSYVRFVFNGAAADSFTVRWQLTGEH